MTTDHSHDNDVTVKANLTAIVAPAVTDDSSKGYAIFSPWVNTAADAMYWCANPAIGAAVWLELAGSVSGLAAHLADLANPHVVTATQLSLGNVENTALSTWAGSANITTLGTITTGVWQGTVIDAAYLANPVSGSVNEMLTDDGSGGITSNSEVTFDGTTFVAAAAATFQNALDSTTGFQVLDANGGTPIFNVDTTNERVGINEAAPAAQLHVQTSGAGVIGEIIQATADQTANLLEWRDSSGNVVARVNENQEFSNPTTSSGALNESFGDGVMQSITSGFNNTAFGNGALAALSSGSWNVGIGRGAGAAINSGTGNICVGEAAGAALTTAVNNMCIGTNALLVNQTGASNTAVGANAGSNTTSANNVFLGTASGNKNTSGGNNICIGNNAGQFGTTGGSNTYIGTSAGTGSNGNTTSAFNVALGQGSLQSTTTGSSNVCVGVNTGNALTTGTTNVIIGVNSGLAVTGSGNVLIGNAVAKTQTAISNQLWIDNADNSIPLVLGDFSNRRIDINGTLTTTAGRIRGVTRKTTTYTILVTDDRVFCNTDSAGFTATLPAGAEGQTLRVINSGSSANTLTIAPNGAEHLLGANSNFTLADAESLELTYNASDGWY